MLIIRLGGNCALTSRRVPHTRGPIFCGAHTTLTDAQEIIQARYHQQLFQVLIPTLEAAEPRYVTPLRHSSPELTRVGSVAAHAAAALINFCEGVERDTLIPYLDEIVERLLKLLHPGTTGKTPKRYVQEQAITTLAMVADASEATFAKVRCGVRHLGYIANIAIQHYSTIMPLLLNVLQNANTPDYKTLRVKAMECAGLIGA